MRSRKMAITDANGLQPRLLDKTLLFCVMGLITLGLLMVASASMTISTSLHGQPFYFLVRQSIHLLLGFFLATIVFRIDTRFWEKMSFVLLFISFAILVLVFVPGIGHQVNGSYRWIGIGPFGGQVSEPAKFFMIIYFASFLKRHQQEIRTQISGFVKPMVILSGMAFLLLLEPDFGATVVMVTTVMGMMFLAGARIKYFMLMFLAVLIAIAILAVSSPYRLLRLTSFLNPWDNQFGSGYQLTQSLIAFGQGGWFGVGLGDSVQKLFYLPEAHTDFLFAVLAEELGLAGVFAVLCLFVMFTWRVFSAGWVAMRQGATFAGLLAYGFGLYLSTQALINIGVNSGLLPTKGLTLPFLSYGGSSLLLNCVIVGVLLRIGYENNLGRYG